MDTEILVIICVEFLNLVSLMVLLLATLLAASASTLIPDPIYTSKTEPAMGPGFGTKNLTALPIIDTRGELTLSGRLGLLLVLGLDMILSLFTELM